MAWGSFPCQDLSLAGKLGGISNGQRSALFWEWLRILDEMNEAHPPVLAVENVIGFLISNNCSNFIQAYEALKKRGYVLGSLVIDAVHFVPQSRRRSFLIGVQRGAYLEGLCFNEPPTRLKSEYFPKCVQQAFDSVSDPDWIWWSLPPLPEKQKNLANICELNAPLDPIEKTNYLISLLSPLNHQKLENDLKSKRFKVGTGYKRIRSEGGVKKQRLELRFDGIAGCLRTPNGGSSRQILVIVKNGKVHTRLMTPRETARLMGAPDSYLLRGTYNESYRAMGDAVAVPVTRWLSKHLLSTLAIRPIENTKIEASYA